MARSGMQVMIRTVVLIVPIAPHFTLLPYRLEDWVKAKIVLDKL